MSNWHDLGNGRRIQITQRGRDGFRDFVEEHPRPDGAGMCSGSGRIVEPGQIAPIDHRSNWALESDDPLTLAPSIACRLCGNHGFVREGRWVSA